MVYVTGDTHASFGEFCDTVRNEELTGEDLVIILGDAGFNYFGADADRINKMQVNSLGVPVLCVHGNHEMRPAATGARADRSPLPKLWAAAVIRRSGPASRLVSRIERMLETSSISAAETMKAEKMLSRKAVSASAFREAKM